MGEAVASCLDVENTLQRLTMSEKIDLLAGIDFWHTKGIPRLDIPSIRFSDGPNGVRGTRFFNGVRAACFPCGTGLAATWDAQLLRRAGNLMGAESRHKGASVLLGPTVNMQRSPLGGRGFESFSEDPVLAGICAAAVINGIQDTGVQAAIKHFVANDQEHERMAVNSIVTQRALREIYLLPFQIAVRDSNPASFMTSYNKVNGTHVSEDSKVLKDILRHEWGWHGLVMSDWYGTYSTSEAVNAGLDLEMPGPTRWRGQLLHHALVAKKVRPDVIDERVRAVLTCIQRSIAAGIPENAPEEERDTPETAALLRDIASQGIVLMKNEQDVLPFKRDKKVLVIGPNAKTAVFSGGGSASLRPYYAVTPLDGISHKAENVEYTVGCHAHKMLPVLGPRMRTAEGRTGVTFRAFTAPPSDTDRRAIDLINLVDTDMYFADYYHPEITEDLWWGEIEGFFTPDESGEFEFGLAVFGTANLYVDGEHVIDNETKQRGGGTFFNVGTIEETGTKFLEAGRSYEILVSFASGAASKVEGADGVVSFGGGGVRIGGAKLLNADEEIAESARLAMSVEQVVLCVGLNADFEQEGHDRLHMKLPGRTDDLIAAVAAANPRTVVVVQSGTPVSMPWADTVAGIMQTWYGGNETGNAIADVLFGDVNPSGKLPLSFPICVEDNPAYLHYRSERGRVLYGEDIYVGYRYYETVKKPVLWPFGWGLSYTSFKLSNVDCEQGIRGGKNVISVTLSVTNTGPVDGAEVVQMYIAQRSSSIKRPQKELKGFTKVFVPAKATKAVQVIVERKYATSFWDEERNQWIEEADTYDVFMGTSSADARLSATFKVKATSWWSGL
ncbi:family 3 glycoside hydrolase [Curvularia clavata]|uniref:beta-glucosidase n=1 Tax=Curvularia clavata TaxID=95742 RepID=A0A9Q8ZJN0_CURCL|nr:family 3 glycoside hydrolase [Curvularia clavata]